MTVHIGEITTTIEPAAGTPGGGPVGADDARAGGAGAPAFEVRVEELRALVRALVAEELERWQRRRQDCP